MTAFRGFRQGARGAVMREHHKRRGHREGARGGSHGEPRSSALILMGDRCARRQPVETERNHGSDDAKETTSGARAEREVFSPLAKPPNGRPLISPVVQ